MAFLSELFTCGTGNFFFHSVQLQISYIFIPLRIEVNLQNNEARQGEDYIVNKNDTNLKWRWWSYQPNQSDR